MPAFLTHYACGVCGYRTLPDGWLKKAIRRHTGVFNTGLAGPDLFFYSAVEFRRHGMTIGRAMHKYRTGAFLHNMLDRALKMQGTDRETALVYYAGFVGHYSLDSNAHAFVYRTCHDPDPAVALGKHFRYEAGMDVLCCARMLGRDITRSGQMGLIRLRRSERRVIAALLSGAAGDTYGEEIPSTSVRRIRAILAEYYLISGLLIDPSGFREWGFLQAELFRRGYPHSSPLFINRNLYGLTWENWRVFSKYFKKGVSDFSGYLEKIARMLDEGCDEASRQELEEAIGSRSYHGIYHRDAESSLPIREIAQRRKERELAKRRKKQEKNDP